MIRAIVMLSLLLPGAGFAAKLNKCVDTQGNVTFTQLACAGGLAGEPITVQSASAGMSMGPIAQPVAETVTQSAKSPTQGRVDVIGEDQGSACGTESSQRIRTAILQKKISVGMSAKQAQQSWGSPSAINRSSSGPEQWVYERDGVHSQYIYVSAAGCVTAWN